MPQRNYFKELYGVDLDDDDESGDRHRSNVVLPGGKIVVPMSVMATARRNAVVVTPGVALASVSDQTDKSTVPCPGRYFLLL